MLFRSPTRRKLRGSGNSSTQNGPRLKTNHSIHPQRLFPRMEALATRLRPTRPKCFTRRRRPAACGLRPTSHGSTHGALAAPSGTTRWTTVLAASSFTTLASPVRMPACRILAHKKHHRRRQQQGRRTQHAMTFRQPLLQLLLQKHTRLQTSCERSKHAYTFKVRTPW